MSRPALLAREADGAFDRLTRLATSLIGTATATVWLVDDDRLVPRSVHDSAATGLRPAPRSTTPPAQTLCRVVVADDEPVWMDDIGTDGRAHGSAEVASGVRAWAGLPVRDPSRSLVGVLAVGDVRPRSWSSHDRDVLTTLAQAATGEVALRSALADSRAGQTEAAQRAAASDRAARYYRRQADSAHLQAATSEQHAAEVDELAATLRESLLPSRLPAFPGVEVAARYRPGTGASVLGDFYDLFPTPHGWGAVVGDVCGKGPQAARTTALARSTVRALGHTDDDPNAVLGALHGVLNVWFDQRPSFVTAVYAGIAPSVHGAGLDLAVASAGHPPAVVQRRDGTVTALEAGGRALGIRPEARIAVERLTLDVGDRLVLFTDGVTEARPVGGEEFELEGLLALLSDLDPAGDADTTADAVLAAVDVHAAGATLDDTALMVIRAGRRDPSTADDGT